MALFLLQTSATTTVTLTSLLGVYIALGGTLAAAGLAAFASFRASNKASATAREVAELSTRTAQELKEIDYKQDFYKKIITRRLAAWEQVEQFMSSITSALRDDSDGRALMEYCINVEQFDKTMNIMRLLAISQVFWIGGPFAHEFARLYNENNSIRRRASIPNNSIHLAPIDADKLSSVGKEHYESCAILIHNLLRILKEEAVVLYDVERFFKSADHLGLEL